MFDGNKIERTVTAKYYRDSAGRIRREQSVVGLDALDPSGDPRAVVTILDSVAGVLYTLNPATKEAHAVSLKVAQNSSGSRAVILPPPAPPAPPAGGQTRAESGRVRVQTLGTKDIDGIVATGTRSVTTVGQIGKGRQFEIIDERWESKELQVLLRSLYRDPRSGDIEFALTKISRAEPVASLFVVPPDYTIKNVLRNR